MQPAKMKKGTFNLLEACPLCRRAGDNHQVHAFLQFILMKPIAFSDQTGNPVSYDTVSNLFTYRDPDSTACCLVGGNIHH